MFDQSRAVTIDPVKAEEVVTHLCERAGRPVQDQFTPAEVAGLLSAVGYVVTQGTLAEFVRKRYVSDPGDQWSPVNIYCLAAALESRRRWAPAPGPHDLKKTGIRLELERLQADGVNPPIVDLDRYTLEDLLLQMAQSDNRMEREALYETLRLKLDGFEE
ncbi:MAG TPA: hypothetical protein VM597_37180 [Gemmataceae bacterium]|jgi:hypothetical protein|nr:hypothetical protein [Gemmataceae bacterium]